MRERLAVPLVVAFLGAGCPEPASLRCLPCDSNAECEPQGLTCVAGLCASPDLACSADGGTGGGAAGGGAAGGGAAGGGAAGGGAAGGGAAGGGAAGGGAAGGGAAGGGAAGGGAAGGGAAGGGAAGGGAAGGGAAGGGAAGGGGGGVVAVLPALGAVPPSTLIVQDDFEGGLSLQPAGKWALVDGGASSFDVAVGAGARAGAAALFTHRATGGPSNSGLTLRHDLPSTQDDTYLRAWVQLNATTMHVSALSAYRPAIPAEGLSEVAADLSSRGGWLFQGYSPADGFEEWREEAWDAGWHRVQLRMHAVDTTAGSATIFIDDDTWTKTLTQAQARLTQVAFGPAYFDTAWVGTLHIDNVAVTQSGPPPGRLAWVQASPPSSGCVPVRLELRDDLPGGGALAKAVRSTTLGLSGAAFHSEASCSSPISQVTVSAGAAAKDFWMNAPAGTVSLTATDLGADLASASVTWTLP